MPIKNHRISTQLLASFGDPCKGPRPYIMSDNGETVADVQQDWELSKENYQPLKAGRKPGGLRDPSATEKKLSIDEQRE